MTRDLILILGSHFPVGVLAVCPDDLGQRLWRWWRHLIPGLLLLAAIGSMVGSHLTAWLSLYNFVIANTKSLVTEQDHVGLLVGRSRGRHTCNGWILISCTTGERCLLYYGMLHLPFPLLNHTLWCCVHHLYCLYHIQNYWHYWKVPSMKEVSC